MKKSQNLRNLIVAMQLIKISYRRAETLA